MFYRNGIIEAIGNTPLIKLKRASEETGCTILGKAEFMNPGQSVKDRAALFIIRDALDSRRLQSGGTVVEGTAGNTGIGLALVGNALGLKTVIVIPDTQSDEKKQMLRLAGAELIEVPAVPYKDPNNYVKYSGRLAEQLAATAAYGAIWANQFDNVANRQGHIETHTARVARPLRSSATANGSPIPMIWDLKLGTDALIATPRPEHLEPCSVTMTALVCAMLERHSSLLTVINALSFSQSLNVLPRLGPRLRVRGATLNGATRSLPWR